MTGVVMADVTSAPSCSRTPTTILPGPRASTRRCAAGGAVRAPSERVDREAMRKEVEERDRVDTIAP